MKIEIELTKIEEIYLTTCCIQRVVNSVLKEVPYNYDHMQDLVELGDVMEPLRMKMVDAIFRARLSAAEKK